ncbi:MAG: ANTAR domain-containing response regulator [Acidimicrobiales bacterium]
MTRESLLVSTLVELADNLVDNYDVIEVLTMLSDRCVQVIDVAAAGVMLAQPGGELQYIASSSASMRVLELFQIQSNEGPCMDCFIDGEPIVNYTLSTLDQRWPQFTPRAIEQGVHTVHCLPLKLRGRTIGGLNLFHEEGGSLHGEDLLVVRGLAHVATIAIVQHQATLDAKTLNDQLGHALNSRIIIEQAKGMVSQGANCDMDTAFARLRAHARNHNERLTDVAKSVVDGQIRAVDTDVPAPSHLIRD